MRDFEPRVVFQTHDYGRSIKVQAFKKKEIISVCHEPFHPSCNWSRCFMWRVSQQNNSNTKTNHSGTALSNGLGGSDIIMHRFLCSLCQQSFYQWFIVYVFERLLIYLFLLLGDQLSSKKFQSLSFDDSQNLLVLNHQ